MLALGQIHLFTPGPDLLAKFLIDLFDWEFPQIISEQGIIQLISPDEKFTWIIEKDIDKSLSFAQKTICAFKVEEEQSLYEVWQRYVFAMFRIKGIEIEEKIPLSVVKKLGPKAAEEMLILDIKDYEERCWRFYFTRSLN